MKKPKKQQDKDKQKKSSPQLIKEISQAEGIISAIGDGISILDRTFQILYENQAHRDMMGAHVGEKCYKAYPKRQGICGGCPVALAFKDGKVHTVEREIQTDKGTRYTEITASPLQDSKGNIIAGIEVVRDITDRKQTETALQFSEERYRSTVDFLDDALHVIDKNLNIILINKKLLEWLERFGLEKDVIQKNIFQVYPFLSDKVREEYELVFKTGKPIKTEESIRIDGEEVLTETKKMPVFEGGNVVKVITIIRDITKHKRIEQEIRESEYRYKTLTESSGVGIWHITLDGYTIYLNPAMCAMLEIEKQEELNGMTYHSFFTPESLVVMKREHAKRSLGTYSQYEVEIIGEKGKRSNVVISGAPIFEADGKLASLIGTFTDITERKRAEEALKLESQLLDAATDSIFLHDFDANFIYVNETACKSHGFTKDELMQMNLHDFDIPEYEKLIAPRIKELMEKGEVTFESAHNRKDKTHMPVEVHARIIEVGNKKLILSVARDITERKHSEDKIKFERNQLLSILDSIDEIVYVTDPKTNRILYINPALERAFGKKLVGELCYEAFQNKHAPCDFCTNDIILNNNGQPYKWEYHNPVLNKDFFIIDRIVKWADGRDVRLEFAFDITEQKRSAVKLQDSEKRLASATSIAHVGHWEWSPQTGTVLWTDEVYRIFGYSPGEIIPSYALFLNSLHQDDRTRVKEAVEASLRNPIPYNIEFRLYRKDGSERIGRATGSTDFDQNGDAIRLSGAMQDITEIKQAEREIKESKEKIRMLLDSTAEAIYGVDLEGNCTFVNAACLRILGYEDERKFLGKNIHELIHAKYPDGSEYPEKTCRIYHACRKGKRINVDDEVFWKADGTSFPVEYWSYPIEEEGKAIGAVITFIDITKRKEEKALEDQRAQQKLLNKEALLYLMQMQPKDLEELLKYITVLSAQILGVERASVWSFKALRSEIVCETLYILSKHEREKGLRLQMKNYSQYFEALEESRGLAVENAQNDPRTSEMSEDYLKPYGIVSVIHAPIRRHGRIIGIVCHEHTEQRQWTYEEQEFASSLSYIITSHLENFDRTKAEEELRKHQKELQTRVNELEDFYDMAVGRELRMAELKERIEKLEAELKKNKQQ